MHCKIVMKCKYIKAIYCNHLFLIKQDFEVTLIILAIVCLIHYIGHRCYLH